MKVITVRSEYFHSNLSGLVCVFCWPGTVLLVNDYEKTLIYGYPCGWGAETIGCLLHHLQPPPTVLTAAAAVSSCRLLHSPEMHCNTWRVWSIYLCFVSLITIKLHEKRMLNAQNIFNTITEDRNLKFLYWWWNLIWKTTLNSQRFWSRENTGTFLSTVLTTANSHSMKLSSMYMHCIVVTHSCQFTLHSTKWLC
jgi:hypothetical protein